MYQYYQSTEPKRDGARGAWNADECAPRMLNISSNHVGIATTFGCVTSSLVCSLAALPPPRYASFLRCIP